jgi:hypothetical protein
MTFSTFFNGADSTGKSNGWLFEEYLLRGSITKTLPWSVVQSFHGELKLFFCDGFEITVFGEILTDQEGHAFVDTALS